MKIILVIMIMVFLGTSNSYAWCEFGGLLDFSKEHRYCSKQAKNNGGDEFQRLDAYCECRIRLDNKKKYGVEKLFD